MRQRWLPAALTLAVASAMLLTACSKEHDSDGEESRSLITSPSSTTTPTTTTPTTPTTTTPPPTTTPTTPTTSSAVAFTQDIRPITTSSCTRCHGNFGTYAGLMTVVVAGNPSASRLVAKTQSGGSMYNYLPADRATNSALIRTWVANGAPENR
jgi:hypothetical protein